LYVSSCSVSLPRAEIYSAILPCTPLTYTYNTSAVTAHTAGSCICQEGQYKQSRHSNNRYRFATVPTCNTFQDLLWLHETPYNTERYI
jgi:hypothetical protein